MTNKKDIILLDEAHSTYQQKDFKGALEKFSSLADKSPSIKNSLQYFIQRCNEAIATEESAPLKATKKDHEHTRHQKINQDNRVDLSRDKKTIQNSGLFDEDYYLHAYPKIVKSAIDPIVHFCEHGWENGYEPRADFSCSEYFDKNPDVCLERVNPFCHFIEWGQKENNRYQPYRYLDYATDLNTIVTHCDNTDPDLSLPENTIARIALVIHIHYSNSIQAIAKIINFFPEGTDIFITVTSNTLKNRAISVFNGLKKSCIVYEVPNLGRDIKPFVFLLREVINEKKYDLVCKIHGKSSKDNPYNLNYGSIWRDFMIENLAGSKEVVNKIVHSFAADQKLGLVYSPAPFSVFPYLRWAENWTYVSNFSDALELKEDRPLQHLEFPAGSMYWARTEALKSLLDIFDENKVADEPLPPDGTYLHAVERLITNLILAQGYTYRKHLCANNLTNSYFSADRTLSFHLNILGFIKHKIQLVEDLYKKRGQTRISFNKTSNPLVSIIIPVYNQIEATEKCLISLFSIRYEANFEVIVVNDASNDGTLIALKKYQNLKIVSNNKNLGFVESCNNGLNHAIGKYVLFLNNDTIVLDGGVSNLLRCFDIPKCGLAGSMLIYPDGILQEAGGVVWKDGGGLNFGRNNELTYPDYNYVREVDYCSGASIMLERSTLIDVGGFDSLFSPGYYEDTDLAFRIRKAGLKVIFQPESKIVHFEGKSSGTDLTKGMKRYQVINKEKFVKRWQAELSQLEQSISITNLFHNRQKKARVLLVDSFIPTPDKDSGSKDASLIIDALNQAGYEITFLPTEEILYKYKYWSSLTQRGVRVLYLRKPGDYLGWLDTCREQFNFCIISRYSNFHRCATKIRALNSGVKVFFDTVDLHFLREQREAEHEHNLEKLKIIHQLEHSEIAAIESADYTYVRSVHEIDLLAKRAKGKVGLLPICRELYQPKQEFSKRMGLIFIGGFKHKPNIDAIRYFTQEIWPIILESRPNATLYIAGSNSHLLLQAGVNTNLPGINLIGYVENLHLAFEKHKVNIAPLTYGAGTKGKVISSLCSGIPCVSTSIGSEGIVGLEHRKNILIADNPKDFAECCIELIEDKDLWSKLSFEAYQYAQQNLSTLTMAKHLLTPFLFQKKEVK